MVEGLSLSVGHQARLEQVGATWEGRFTITPEAHAKFCAAVFVDDWSAPEAHPLFLHLVAHCGKGVSLEEFFDALGTQLTAGVTFGQGRLESLIPLRIGATYRVVTEVADVERKQGRQWPFDLVTCRIQVFDSAGELAALSHEAYVIPDATEEQP